MVSPYYRLRAKQTVRNADGNAGKGKWKKRMSLCNEVNRGSKFAPPERVQTSIRFLITRKFTEF